MTLKIRATAYWAKVLGSPVKAFNPGEFEWSLDAAVDPDNLSTLEAAGLGPKIKDDKEYSPHIRFTRRSVKKSGPKVGQNNPPIQVVDIDGEDWDQTKLLGNGTEVEIEFNTYVTTFNKKQFIKPAILKITVLSHVPYEKKNKDEATETAKTAEKWT